MITKKECRFTVDKEKCVRCGRCINTCAGNVIRFGADGYPEMLDYDINSEDTLKAKWSGCWQCEHCIAVCPAGAVSIFGKKPEDLLPPPDPGMGEQMERLVKYRRACRRYLKKNVDPEILDHILSAMQTVPAGGNGTHVEFTVIDDMDRVREIWEVAYSQMEENARNGIYTKDFDSFYYGKMKESEQTLRKDDLLFCGAPHLFIAHVTQDSRWAKDFAVNANIATTYFELLANAYGLGTVMMSYTADVIQDNPKARAMMGIPENHYMGIIVGFGYPEIPYARGVDKAGHLRVHRWTAEHPR